MQELFPGIFRGGKSLYTVNLLPGKKVYGERLVRQGGSELREWVPERSKLAAALMNGIKQFPVRSCSKVLYLGAATGTTVSHVSDIAGREGIVYAIEFSERSFRNIADLAAARGNIAPILADARKPELYNWIEACDTLVTDVAQPDETEIAIRNAHMFLNKGGFVLIAVKSQSIDVTKDPSKVYKEEAEKLRKAGFSVLQLVNLEPYEQKHALIAAIK
ncbi:MAG: fibrillarin-like rRNA/tRNA 2'-O-methyltransferase [Candidatus Aenigmarchaeota archaeon]|nr:fibrillarin-like rRNA/tRNA 2'-O-methyltransferase [Candidatus Aenigmarchaeota archaeon]